jgi:hypothetical protein
MNTRPGEKRKRIRFAELETLRRKGAESFMVLKAISELLPQSEDVDCRARGDLGVANIATRAIVSINAVARSLASWRQCRVVWLSWKGQRVWEVRFERAVVETLLKAWRGSPRQVGRLLIEHRRQREAVAPRRPKLATELVQVKGVPETPPTFAP